MREGSKCGVHVALVGLTAGLHDLRLGRGIKHGSDLMLALV